MYSWGRPSETMKDPKKSSVFGWLRVCVLPPNRYQTGATHSQIHGEKDFGREGFVYLTNNPFVGQPVSTLSLVVAHFTSNEINRRWTCHLSAKMGDG